MRTVGLGIQSFEKIRSNNQFYVDKTAFIGEWYRKNDDITLVTRPRRFGKTLTVDMLNCFFSTDHAGRKDLFAGLAVSGDEEMMRMQGAFPTIKLSFAGIKGRTFREFLRAVAGKISFLLNNYRFLLEDKALEEDERLVFREMAKATPRIPDPEKEEEKYAEYLFQMTHILHLLSIWLYRHYGKKALIFLDEYDTPIQGAFLNHYYEDAIAFMRELFSETFKENEHMGRAVITGITRIAKESLFSDMNNLAVYSVMSGGYDEAFGFTSAEMDGILKEFGIEDRRNVLQAWYDGFTIGNAGGIYNPWSVISYLAKRDCPPEDYWAQSGGLGLVDHLLKKGGPALKEGFEALLGGGELTKSVREDLIYPRLDADENAVWSLLIAAGYLKPVRRDPSSRRTTMILTNNECRICLEEMVKGWFEGSSGNYMENFANALLAGDLFEMNLQMQQAVLLHASSFDSGTKPFSGTIQPELFFHGLTLGMLICLSDAYRLSSNRESGYGRYDVCLEPLRSCTGKNAKAFILEFKVFSEKEGDKDLEDTARRARRQIDENRYDADLLGKGYPAELIRKYGFGFRGKEILIVE